VEQQKDADQDALAAIHAAGAAAWPQLRVLRSDFASYASGVSLSQAASAFAGDVFLACACLAGDPRALLELERLLAAQVPLFVQRIDRATDFVDEVRQRVRELLLQGDPPKLARYSGMGALLAWLRVVTIRAALDIKRAASDQEPAIGNDIAEHMAIHAADPELDLMKQRFHGMFDQAMVAAVGQLTARQRGVLRLYLVGELNIDEIGKIYDVHRSTIARWISTAQRTVLDGVRAHLRDRYDLNTADLRSLGRLVRSELQVSLSRLLRS
jgi:RNA polymerase sigma-70 factor (ECF subfamily)